MTASLLIHNVHLPDGRGPTAIRIVDGVIAAIGETDQAEVIASEGVPELDGLGGVVLAGATDGHIHLDQSLLRADWVSMGQPGHWRDKLEIAETTLATATGATREERIEAQARRVLGHGTLTIRNHASLNEADGTASLDSLLAVRERLKGLLEIQIVAFPQYGTSSKRMVDILEEAMRLGCEVVGGVDPATSDEDIEGQLRVIFTLADQHAARIDIHLHDPGYLGLFEMERICDWTDALGLSGRVNVSHAIALGECSRDAVEPVLERLLRAQVSVVTNGNLDVAMPRTPDLDRVGVALGIGSDAAHTMLPFGTSDMLRKANLIAQRDNLMSDDTLAGLWHRISEVNATIVGRAPRRIEPGAPADLMVASARSVAEAVVSPPRDRWVVVRGEVVAGPRPEGMA